MIEAITNRRTSSAATPIASLQQPCPAAMHGWIHRRGPNHLPGHGCSWAISNWNCRVFGNSQVSMGDWPQFRRGFVFAQQRVWLRNGSRCRQSGSAVAHRTRPAVLGASTASKFLGCQRWLQLLRERLIKLTRRKGELACRRAGRGRLRRLSGEFAEPEVVVGPFQGYALPMG